MLDFYSGSGGLDNLGEYLGGISAEAICWLQQNDFLIKGTTGHKPDPVESLHPGDDVVLSHAQVVSVYKKFHARLDVAEKTPGFDSNEVGKLKEILEKALEEKQGLSTVAD